MMLAAFDLTVLIGPAIGIASLAMTVYIWRRGRVQVTKAISYRLTSPAVVSVHHGVEDRITVHYDNDRVTDVRLLNLRVENTGHGEITATHFGEPFSVALGEDARILGQPTVVATTPLDLLPEVSIEGASILIAPLLLNEGDYFEISALVSNLGTDGHLRARIAGIAALTNMDTIALQPQQRRFSPFTSLAMPRPMSLLVPLMMLLTTITTTYAFTRQRQQSVIFLTTGPPLCGEVMRVDATSIVLKLKRSGIIRVLPLKTTRAIRDHAC
jgi:hypothetical protein